MHPSPAAGAQAGPSNSGKSCYVVKSSDVLQDMRVNVFEEGSEQVIWYKERFLGDDEIIENVVHNPSSTICWTIHRPKRGWYIRIRSPVFPPGVFIPLTPVPSAAHYHTEAAISFSSRTNIPSTAAQLAEETQFTIHDEEGDATSSSASIHSYPPTPTAISNAERCSSSSSSTSGSISQTSFQSSLKPIPTQITQFVLSPTSTQPIQQPANASFFTRALSVLKSHQPSHSNSFTLSRLLAPNNNPLCSPPPYASSVPLPLADAVSPDNLPPALHQPLLVFHDRTPLLTVRSLTGLIEIDKAEERILGVDTSFWIAMGLTYLEFLEERESYLAALSD